MAHNRPRPLYWLITGGLLGIGFNSLLFVVLVPAGVALAVYGVTRLGRRGLWAALFGFGLPMILLTLYPYYTVDHCGPGMELTARGVGEEVTCMYFPPDYLSKLPIYAVISGAGLLWGILEKVKRGGRRMQAGEKA